MEKTTKNSNTPGGTPDLQVNPPSSEVGFIDSGGSQLLLNMESSEMMRGSSSIFQASRKLVRSPTLKTPIVSSFKLQEKYVSNTNTTQLDEINKALAESRQENKSLNATVLWMQEHIQLLEEQIKQLKEHVKMDHQTIPEVQENVIYMTDEEELAKETEWIRVKSLRKKRKRNSSTSPPKPKEPEVKKTGNDQITTKKVPPPPPVIINEMNDYDSLYEKIKTIVPIDKFKTKLMNGNNVKINVENGKTYRELTKMLNEDKLAWHTYENKQTRPIRVMAKNLHHTCKPEKIIDDLRARGFQAIDATIKLKLKTKEPLNMFMLTFSSDENIEKVYQIKSILGCKVDIQPLRRSNLIPQCKRCQSYGHTQAYCSKEPRCVKCVGKHHTIDCNKAKETLAKCVHCGEDHPANYRGCKVPVELQKIKNKNMRSKNTVRRSNNQSNRRVNNPNNNKNTAFATSAAVDGKFTYAQVTANVKNQEQVQNGANINQTLQMILNKLNSFDERLQRLEYSNKGAIPKQRNV